MGEQKKRGLFRCAIVLFVGAWIMALPQFAPGAAAPAEQLSLESIKKRIENLTPTFEKHVRFEEGLDLLGIDVQHPESEIDSSRQSESVCAAEAGTWLRVILFLQPYEVLMSHEFPVALVLDEKRVARRNVDIEEWEIGGVYKEPLDVRIPITYSPGKGIVQIGSIDENGKAVTKIVPLFSLEITPTKLVKETGQRAYSLPVTNFINNWSFEENPSQGDWEISWHPGLEIDIDESVSWHGSRSLRVDFHGGYDANFHHVVQTVPLKPDTAYRLAYRIRTLGINSFSGPRVELWDRNHFHVATTDAFSATNWKVVEVEFETPSTIGTVYLRLRRFGAPALQAVSGKTGTIGGTVWYDGFELEELR